MKRKDIIVLALAFAVIAVAGYMYLNQGKPKTATAAAVKTAQVVPVIDNGLDPDHTLDNLQTKYKVQDFKQAFDTEQGLHNPTPFVP